MLFCVKLTTMGTSHGDPTKIRFNTSNTLEVGDNIYLIDAGVPVNALYIRKYSNDFSKVRAIFITHMHDDHVGGLPSFIKSLIKYPSKDQHTHIFLPENAEKQLRSWLLSMHLSNFDNLITFHKVNEGSVYDDGTIKVTAFGTRHIKSEGEPITFGYLFEAEGKRMLYSGDLTMDFSDFPMKALEKGVDLCVCECTHYPIALAVERLAKAKIGRFLFNHVGDRWASCETEGNLTEQFEGKFSGKCAVAHDGDEIII